MESPDPATWDQIVAANLEQRKLNKINPLINARLVVGKKFPIPAQFIFELLQNAEDAEAKNVILTFENDEFTCEHDGKRQFLESDAIGISRIGYTGKNESQNSIGRFGLGFKSVFQYTDSVRIHSGKFNFSLFDYLWINNGIPRPLNLALGDSSTAFIFKVSDVIIEFEKAQEEIVKGLQDLNHRCLIFLKHVSNLELHINGKLSRIVRQSQGENVFEITIEEGASIKRSLWFRAIQTISLPVYLDSPSIVKKGTFGLAIQLDADQYASNKTVPIPSDKGVVFSYFPLSLENSGLRFFIHAPFFVEDNRLQFSLNPESAPGNKNLLSELGKMASSTFYNQIISGVDQESIISLLPLASEISELYFPFYQSLIEGLKIAKIVKSQNGDMKLAEEFIDLSADLQSFFHEYDLALLARCIDTLEDNPIRDADKVPIEFQPKFLSARSLKVLSQIGMIEVSNRVGTKIIELFSGVFNPSIIDSRVARPSPEVITNWLETRSSQDLANLYSFIANEFNSNEILNGFPIFRVGFKPRRRYLPYDQIYLAQNRDNSDHDILDAEIFNLDDQLTNLEMKKLVSPLRKFGISPKDKWEVLKKDYKDASNRSFSEVVEKQEFIRLLNFYREDKSRLLQIIKPSITLFCMDQSATLVARKPTSSIMRNHENENLLLRLFSDSTDECNIFAVWDGYYCEPDSDNLLHDLGFHQDLFVFKLMEKYEISFLSQIIHKADKFLARYLWNFLLTLEKREYFNIAIVTRAGGVLIETELSKILKENDWIPCKDGVFRKPYDCDRNLIDDGFEYHECLALEKLDFGGSTRDHLRNSEIEQEKAKSLGFDSIEEVEDYKAYIKLVGKDFIKRSLADYERKQFETDKAPSLNYGESTRKNEQNSDSGIHLEENLQAPNFRPSEPRYVEDSPVNNRKDNNSNSGNRNSEISKTSELYADSIVTEQGQEKSARLKEIESKSRKIIEKANKVLGRDIVSMHEQNEGYDFEFHENGRKKYIEAKGTVNKWDAAGIRLSRREMEYANRYGTDYEIWIVEELESEKPKIWRINDFPSKIGGFRLNESWIPQAMLFGYDFGEVGED